MTPDWQSGASPEVLQARDRMLRVVRSFFQKRGVIEVGTPVLGSAGVSDPHIENIQFRSGARTWYLQTSPEYAMKRLLAGGSGPIYQVCPAFRGGESGERHNIEFTMLEWYRPGFTLAQLADEVASLIEEVACEFGKPVGDVPMLTYQALFEKHYGVNPHTCDVHDLSSLVAQHYGQLPEHLADFDAGTANDLLDYLFSSGIEKSLEDLTIVINYPERQAALSEIIDDGAGNRVAGRFECFWQGTELANGYLELRDSAVLRARMDANNALRQRRGMPEIPPDEKLIAALPGMPACSGVALGLDRLLVLLVDAGSIDEVLTFSDRRI